MMWDIFSHVFKFDFAVWYCHVYLWNPLFAVKILKLYFVGEIANDPTGRSSHSFLGEGNGIIFLVKNKLVKGVLCLQLHKKLVFNLRVIFNFSFHWIIISCSVFLVCPTATSWKSVSLSPLSLPLFYPMQSHILHRLLQPFPLWNSFLHIPQVVILQTPQPAEFLG